MVHDELTDGERIARLLSSEVHGHERGSLGRLAVVDAAADVEPTVDGTYAYAIELTDDDVADDDVNDGVELDVDVAPDDLADEDVANDDLADEDVANDDLADEDVANDDLADDGADEVAPDVDEPRRIAEVYVHPDRAHVAFRRGVESAAVAGEAEGLRVRPKAVEPPRTLVFVENGAEVKAALRVVRAVADGFLEDGG